MKPLLEDIANARPEDEARLRRQIDEEVHAAGDVGTASTLHEMLTDALQPGTTLADRQKLLEDFHRLALNPPGDVAGVVTTVVGHLGNSGRGPRARFADEKRLNDHFDKHRDEFGAASAEQYEAQAAAFLTNPLPKSVLQLIRDNGDIVRYNPITEEFSIISKDHVIRSYYKLDTTKHPFRTNLEYFYSQIKRIDAITTQKGKRPMYMCPVCGWPNLDMPIYDEFGCVSFDICPCCATQFGYDDYMMPHSVLREQWIANGMKWFSRTRPDNWDPVRQLQEAGFLGIPNK